MVLNRELTLQEQDQLSKNYSELVISHAELIKAIEGTMKIKSLWIPPDDYHGDEHNGEFIALNSMRENFEKVLIKAKKA